MTAAHLQSRSRAAPLDVERVRADFPILARVHGRPLVYLDSAASAQKPRAVIDAMSAVYERGLRQRPSRRATT